MIKQYVLDELRAKMDITEVVSPFVAIKKGGTGSCPFHAEKSASFHIWKSKQIYKCFGCGEGGDAIKFIMKHERKTFTEAVEYLCAQYHIAIEWDQQEQQVSEEKKTAKEEQLQLVQWAGKKYEDLLHSLPEEAAAVQYLKSRGYTEERMKAWSLGFAPDDWKFLTTPCINMGKFQSGVDCGLLYTNGGKNWDFFRNRIIIPIHDHNGVLVGFGGRLVPETSPTGGGREGAKQPKYLNPCESAIYSKSRVWYGLGQAQKAIKEAGFAYVTEGYMDVQAMHDQDICNTVASCGTEIDDAQVKLLKRYTDHAVLAYDGDEPGIKKAIKQIDLFLKHDFKVSIIQLPDALDPDEYIRQLLNNPVAVPEGAAAE